MFGVQLDFSPEGTADFKPVQIRFEKRLGPQPLFVEPWPFPLSSRAKPRDLRFRGPLLETRNTMLK